MYLTSTESIIRVGIIGTGFIANGLITHLFNFKDIQVTKVLTRRNLFSCSDFPYNELLTHSINELIDHSDLVIECSGDPIHATAMINDVMDCQLPIITMNSEFHVTTGSYFASKGFITEAEGDQPGCLGALKNQVLQMGFTPIVYGNMKGFLNHNPNLEEMLFWSKKQGISLEQVTSFTDGTKIQIEQAFVANGLNAEITNPGLTGIKTNELSKGIKELGALAASMGKTISDYVLTPHSLPGVFILASNAEEQASYLKYLKMGDGPYYLIQKDQHLCHLEIPKTIKDVIENKRVLLNNGVIPRISVASVAKRPLMIDDKIKRGLGGFDARGIAVNIDDYPEHVPIGLLTNARIKKNIEAGQIINFDDVDLPDSLALDIWFKITNELTRNMNSPQNRVVL